MLDILVCYRAVTVNAAAGIIRGYIFIWGSPDQRDAYDTWFDKARPPEMDIDNGMHRRPIKYEHSKDPAIDKVTIAVITRVWFDDIGLAYEGELDRSSPYFGRLVGELRRRELKTSSATMPHTAAFYPDGAFKIWTLGELSLTKHPAEERMPETVLIRSAEGERDARRDDESVLDSTSDGDQPIMDLQQILQQLLAQYSLEEIMAALQAMQPAAEGQPAEMSAPGAAPATTLSAPNGTPAHVDPQQFMRDLRVMLEARRAQTQQATELATLRQQVEALTRGQQQANSAPPPPEPLRGSGTAAGDMTVSEPRKFWGKTPSELMFGYLVMRSAQRAGKMERPISEEYIRVMANRVGAAIAKDDPVLSTPHVRSALLPGQSFTRANEIATSTATGGGDEWVAAGWSEQIWEKVRNNRIFADIQRRGMRVEEVPDGQESVDIYTEGADPTVYTISQQTDLDATGRPTVQTAPTRIGTGKVTLTPGELGMAVAWTDVFEEDSVIRVLAQYTQQMNEKAEETVEQLFINGDTATGGSANINLIDGTPGTGLSKPYYLASDGALKYALVTGSGTSRDGGALDANDFRLTMKLFPSAIRTRKQQMAFIIDSDTHNTALDILEVKTEDVRTSKATIVSGELTNIWGVDTLESGFMLLANSAGKIPAAGGTLGRILGVFAPYWAMGWKRRSTVEQDRDILSGTNIVVLKMRLGFKIRGAGGAVCSYNLTV